MLHISKRSVTAAIVCLMMLGQIRSLMADTVLYINEFMASNKTGIIDPDELDEYPDWVEIYNPNPVVVDLSGMYLTDDLTDPMQWQFASGVAVPAQGFLLIYADDDGTQGPLHTNFKLSASGEDIGLIDVDGSTVIDSITFGAQEADVAYGRYPDGGAWGVMITPTPGETNNNPPPVIDDLDQSPTWPTATYPVLVLATVIDDVSVASVLLTYDAGSGSVTVPMYDDGLHNDGAAGDDVYGVELPGFAYNTTVEYYITATDNNGRASTNPVSAPIIVHSYYVTCAPNDFDCDGDVDDEDYQVMAPCMTGPAGSYDPTPYGCILAIEEDGFISVDFDEDGDVDLGDFGVFQECVSGPGVPADSDCGRTEAPSGITQIILNGTTITVSGPGVSIDGSVATITSAGVYRVTGTLTDGQIVVDTIDGDDIEIILDGASVTNTTNAPFAVMGADNTIITLADGSQNTFIDTSSYVFPDPEEDEPNASFYSKDPMTIQGNGTLTVFGNYNDGITSKDTLEITGGTIIVNAVDDGIRGKDSLTITDGDITVVSGGDGFKADNEDGADVGYMVIEGGSIEITAGGDAITAETDVMISGGTFDLTSGGGAGAVISDDLSAKGIKGQVSVTIDSGIFTIDAADDAVHSNATVVVNGGEFTIATGDDGFHSDDVTEINGGIINITESYEGIEGVVVTINDGAIHVVSSDDGINGAGGVDGSGGPFPPPPPTGDCFLYINGGYIVVYAAGDGIDVNGTIEMTGGTVIVHGPTENFNSALDFDVSFEISGGFLLAAGSSGMAQAPSSSSTQRSIKVTYSSPKAAGTLVHLQTSVDDIFTFAPSKTFQSVVFSSLELQAGTSYQLYRGGSSTGTVTEGLYEGGTYSPGSTSANFTITQMVTNVNAS